MEGVVRAPSEFSITLGLPPSMIATHELVVPRSMPMIFAMGMPLLPIYVTYGVSVVAFKLLGDGNERRPQHAIMQHVAFLHERNHGIGFAAARFDRRHCMVAMGVEALALRRTDFPDVGALERRPELLQGQLDPAAQCLRTGVFAAERGLHAVEDRQELLGEALHSVFLRRRRLRLGALAGVFCVRHRAQHGVALLLQLGLCLGQQLLERLVFAWGPVGVDVLLLHAIELGMGPEAFKPGLAIPAKLLSY